MAVKTYREAISEVLQAEMRRDPRVIILGEDVVGGLGGSSGEDEAAGGTFELTDQAAAWLASAAEALPEGAWALRRPLYRFVEEVLVSPSPASHWRFDEAEARRLLDEA